MPTTVAGLRSQVEDLFDYIADAALDEALAVDLPFVDDALTSALTSGLPVFTALENAILAALDDVDEASATLIADLAAALDALAFVTASVNGDTIAIGLDATDSLVLAPQAFAIDVGLPALGFAANGSVQATLDYALDVDLLLATDTGIVTTVDNGASELSLALDAGLTLPAAEGTLGFLTLDLTDTLTTPEIQLDFALDLAGGRELTALTTADVTTTISGAANLALAFKSTLGTDLLPTITGDLLVDYTVAPFDPATGLSGLGTIPSVQLADIELELGSIVDFIGNIFEPIISEVFSSFPLGDLIDAVTTPLPIIDDGLRFLGLLEIFDRVADDQNEINLLDLSAISGGNVDILNAFALAFSFIKGINDLDDQDSDYGIPLGSITLAGEAPTAPGAMAFTALAAAPDFDFLPAPDPLAAASSALGGLADLAGLPDQKRGLGGVLQPLADVLQSVGLSVPLLSKPESILPILLNGFDDTEVTLIQYDVPALAVTAGFSKFFPIIGPIGVGVGGEFGAEIDVDFGYDTRGLRTGKFAEGFFFTTEQRAGGPIVIGDETTNFEPAGTITARLEAFGGVDVVFAAAFIGGGLMSTLESYFPGEDGKLRLSDIGEGCIFDPIAGRFTADVFVKVRIGFGPFSFSRRFEIVEVTLAEFSFGCEPPESDPERGLATLGPAPGGFGAPPVDAGTFALNVGPRAGLRSINGRQGVDGDETFFVRHAFDPNDALIPGALAVSAFGIVENYGGPGNVAERIFADGGAGRDVLVVASDVARPALLLGNVGEDLLQGGAANDTLIGGADSDRLIGGAGNDELFGNDGDDFLEGGLGADKIEGAAGRDQVTYENSPAAVIFSFGLIGGRPGFIGSGGEATGDVLFDIEYLIGSRFADVLNGNPGAPNTLEGLGGADILRGGGQDDLLLGGPGPDAHVGFTGNDTVSYVSSPGQVTVRLGSNLGLGGDAAGDTFSSIENVQGSFGDDAISGNGAANIIDGFIGDDLLAGLGGADTVMGGPGDDTVQGGRDGDQLDGGGTVNVPARDLLSYRNSGLGVTINLRDGTGNDSTTRAILQTGTDADGVPIGSPLAGYSTFEDLDGSDHGDILIGDFQYNVIRGFGGVDAIDGEGGDDTLVGGAGADFIRGGAGIDLADYRSSPGAVSVNLATNTGLFADAQGDTFDGIENLRGSDFADTLVGRGPIANVTDGVNRIDPGLSRSAFFSDFVDGAGAVDTLAIDYGRGDSGKGLIGGFDPGSSSAGSFRREQLASSATLDRVVFQNIERLSVIGTVRDDYVFGGPSHDLITTGSGDDLIIAGLGVDRVFAGRGDDRVSSGTDANRVLSSLGGLDQVELDGGRGIDRLSISLAAFGGPVVLTGGDGDSEFDGVNAGLGNGTGIRRFEILGDVLTGNGDDVITQLGDFNNYFASGFGVDVLRPGLGNDYMDGGQDYRIGREVFPRRGGFPEGFYGVITIGTVGADQVLLNDGDLLELDYSDVSAPVSAYTQITNTGYSFEVHFPETQGRFIISVLTNSGGFNSGEDGYGEGGYGENGYGENGYGGNDFNRVGFDNIERLSVIGSAYDDVLTGTDLLFGRNFRSGGIYIASQSARGDDYLSGGDGDDTIEGKTGDDTILGGEGDDVIIGARDDFEDNDDFGEIDELTGGAGADLFVLGNSGNSFYQDYNDSFASLPNRAIITDFDTAEDRLLLSGLAQHYRTVEDDGTTLIYVRDGRAVTGAPDPSRDELIAEVRGVVDFDLGGDYVVYTSDADFGGIAVAARTAPAAAAFDGDKVALASVATTEIESATVTTAAIATAAAWVTQTSDPETLRAALFGAGSPLGGGVLTTEGDSSAFGTFAGDPFGLGEGIVISTGAVEDLAGVNLEDGGLTLGRTVQLTFVKIGRVGSSDIFRADLSGLGFDIQSLRLGDNSGGFGGASGNASGFDIDAIALSSTLLEADDLVGATDLDPLLPRIDAFAFNAAAVRFLPGTQRPATSSNFPNAEDVFGATNGLPDFSLISLGDFDSDGSTTGAISLGDGGSLGLDLKMPVSTGGPLYLYVGEAGASGEVLVSGFTASSNRLETPTDLSTDLGLPGVEGDTVAIDYRFTPLDAGGAPDPSVNTVVFEFVFFSEELVEYAQTEFNDNFKIMLNGVNLARLSDGSFASVSTLFAPPGGGNGGSGIFGLFGGTPPESDLIYNPVADGPAANDTRADGFSRILRFVGTINPGVENVLRIEASDVRDGLLDSGILIRGGSFSGTGVSSFVLERDDTPLREGDSRDFDFSIVPPTGGSPSGPLTATFTPTAGLDLGAGPGQPVSITIDPGGPLAGEIVATALQDGFDNGQRLESIAVSLAGAGLDGPLAPLVLPVDDAPLTRVRTFTLGDAPVRFDRSQPNAWIDAWTEDGVTITHAAVRGGTYSAVNLGTANPGVLSGSDMLAGDLGVSGRAGLNTAQPQEIGGTEALRFVFEFEDANGFDIDFARFEAGDVARLEFFDGDGLLMRTEFSMDDDFVIAGLDGVAALVVSASAGAFVIDSVKVDETVPIPPPAAFAAFDASQFEPPIDVFIGMRGGMRDEMMYFNHYHIV